jgi:drug/metabolite transporter (DMT)-like permease
VQSQRSGFWLGIACLLTTVTIWGFFLPVSKSVLQTVDPFWLNVIRYWFAALLCAGVLVSREGLSALSLGPQARKLWVFGTLGYVVYALLVYIGAPLARSEHGAAILAMQPVFLAVYLWVSRQYRPSSAQWIFILCTVLGVVLLITQGDFSRLMRGGSQLGNALILLSALGWVGYTLGLKHTGYSPLRYTTLACICGNTVATVITLALTATGHATLPQVGILLPLWPQLLFIIVALSALSIVFWNIGVEKVGALNAALFMPFAPVVTFVIVVAQGQTFSAIEVSGALLAFAALVANALIARSKAMRLETAT